MFKMHYDFIVIGGGSGGYAGARTAREKYAKVAIVDGADKLGGLCILKGCMPSKTVIYAAEVLHHAHHGEQFGLKIPQAKVDMEALRIRKEKIIGDFADYRVQELESDQFKLYRNNARFIDEKTIILDNGNQLSGDHFLIATGSIINHPIIPGLDSVPFLTSDEVLTLNSLPESIIVLGGGIVACELTQYLNRIGSKVTMIQRSEHILKESSSKAANVIENAFRDEGIELYTNTKIENISLNNEKIQVTFSHRGKKVICKATQILNSLGRIPNTLDLGLENAGIDLLPSGHIKINANQQTSNARVYAAGDCCGPHEIVHIAIMQGELAAKHASGQKSSSIIYDHLLKIIFTDPQVATVGLTDQDLLNRKTDYLSAEFPFNDHGKSILMEAKYGYVKVLARKPDGRIVGAECVGKDAGEIIHSLAVAVSIEATVNDLLKTHWYHPTLSEIWTYPLEKMAEELNDTT